MSEYDIEKWGVVTNDNVRKTPIIYVKPDKTFLEFARANEFSVMCEISGTGMGYDTTVKIPGVVNRSSDVPNCRPNYYKKTGQYVVTLDCPWIGYPPKNNGVVKFFGLKEKMDEPVDSPVVELAENSEKEDNKNEYFLPITIGGIAIFLFLFCVIMVIRKNK